MLSYYRRYLDGDCEAVWADLIGLGAEVRHEYVYPDAVTVIAETLRRARHNVSLLHGRLTEWGFRFALPDRSLVWAAEGADQDIDHLEATLGQLPLLAKAWYEFFDSVNFLPAREEGSHSLELPNYGFECLVVDSLSIALKQWEETCEEYDCAVAEDCAAADADPAEETDTSEPLGFYGWDPRKAPVLWVGTPATNCVQRGFSLPDVGVDGVFYNEGAGDVYFIEELRACFRWGGFRFLEWFRDSTDPVLPGVRLAGRELVPALVQGLLPL